MWKRGVACAAVVLLTLVGLSGPARAGGPEPIDVPLVEAISALEIADEGGRKGYGRDAFPHWKDHDGDGCDTRKEVLYSEATEQPEVGPRCRLLGGRWQSYYDGLEFDDSGDLDVDHVVPLAEAWDSGAGEWTKQRRERYANDLDEPRALVAVSAASNRSKADRDPREWMPPDNGSWCRYVTDWVTVKVRWGLTVDKIELLVLAGVALQPSCADERVVTTLAE